MRFELRPSAWLLLAALMQPVSAFANDIERIVPGYWLELRGEVDVHGIFQAQRVELIQPQSYEVLIGTVSSASDTGEFMLLGQSVQVSRKTVYREVMASKLLDKRVKVEGHYRGPKRFSARKISTRSAGRERIVGRLVEINRLGEGYSLRVLNQTIYVAAGVELLHDKDIAEFVIDSMNIGLPQGKQLSEDDQFGEGFRISRRVRFTSLVEARYTGEDNYNLDQRRDQDLEDSAASIRGRLVLSPGNHGISGQIEVRHTRIRRNQQPFRTFSVNDTRLGESFVYLDDPFGADFDIQAGRMDFDDRREWLYDQNLDGVRVYWTVSGWLVELSATTTLSKGKIRDENTNNFMAYVSDHDRHLAVYLIHRDTDLLSREKVTHLGLRVFESWPPQHNSWLELAYMSGKRDSTSLRGWGIDIGTTREIGERWYLSAGWAFGEGDDNTQDGTDTTFRQTRLQDNNGKLGGVTSFRYYGELIDPELANMHVATLGIGYRFTERGSIDLVGHYYRQDKAVRKILDSDIDQKPNGINRELGWEVDAIFGWRPVSSWDFEFVLGWFSPGKAFRVSDDAWVSKLQIRYRY